MPTPTTTTKQKLTPTQLLQKEIQGLRKPLTLPGVTYTITETDQVLSQMQDLHAQAIERSAHIEGRAILHSIRIIKRYREIISYQEL